MPYSPECVEGVFSELHMQHPAYPRSYGAENARRPNPGAERRCPHVVVPYKDAPSCVVKDRRRGSKPAALGADCITRAARFGPHSPPCGATFSSPWGPVVGDAPNP